MATVLLTGLMALSAAPERRAVVLTTDCGAEVDDQWALAHLALSPEFDLKGVVTTHAPSLPAPAAESSARIARRVLARLPLADHTPVLAGSSQPLADRTHPRSNPGVDFLNDQARGHSAEDRLVVLVIGAATDAASAILTDPTFADRVAIVAMGFDAWPDGGDAWNVKNDVRAWQVLLESRAPIVVGDADVTRRHLAMTRAKADALLAQGGEAGVFLREILANWLDKQGKLAEKETGRRDTWPIWDEVAVAYLLGLTTSEARPRPALRDDLTLDHDRAGGSITWVTAIDAERLWADLRAKISRTCNPR